MNEKSGIYGIMNKQTGEWYVGQAVNIDKRIKQHLWLLANGKHKNEKLQRDWEKLGKEAFCTVKLEACQRCDLDERERFWIQEKDSFRNGYNLTAGGGGIQGHIMPEAEKAWRSERFSGEGNPFYGKKHTEETRAKLSKSHSGERHVNYGKHLSEETRRKISEGNKGRHCTEETKRKLSEINKGKGPTYEAKIKGAIFTKSPQNPQCRAVRCVETEICYYSTAEAARQTGLSRTKITACCSGRRKTTGGFHWEYAE